MSHLFTVKLADNYDLDVDMCDITFVSRTTGQKFEMTRDQFKCITHNQEEITDLMFGPNIFADCPKQFYQDIGDGMNLKINGKPILIITNKYGHVVKLTAHDYNCITFFTDLMSWYSVRLRD